MRLDLRGNRLLAFVALLACALVVALEPWQEREVLARLDASLSTEAPWRAEVQGARASDHYVSRGMPDRGFRRLAALALDRGGPPVVLREVVRVAAEEEARWPNLGLGGEGGLARLEAPEWAALHELLGGHVPQEGHALWRRREYPRAAARLAEVLNRGPSPFLGGPAEQAETCFLLADTWKALGQHAEAARVLRQLAGPAAEGDPPGLAARRPRDLCRLPQAEARAWARRARAELITPGSLALTLRVTRRGIELDVALVLDRETLRGLAEDPAALEAARYGLPGAALGGMRVNDRFLADLTPARRALATRVDGRLAVGARYVLAHDDVALWRNGPLLEGGGLPEALPLELVLPLGARDAPVSVRLDVEAVRLGGAAPLPVELDGGHLMWGWGPESPEEDRAPRLLAEVSLGALNTLGVVLPIASPATPPAALGGLMAAVVALAAAAHVARRRDRPWLADASGNLLIELLVAAGFGAALALVVARPLVRAVLGGQPLLALGSAEQLQAGTLTYAALGLVLTLTLATARQSSWAQALFLRRLGGLLFAGYLAVWFGSVPWWQILLVGGVVAPAVWFWWLSPSDRHVLRLTTAEARAVHRQRDALVAAAFALRDVEHAREALEAWPARIAQGQGGVAEFQAAREALGALEGELGSHLDGLRDALNAREVPVSDLVMGIGPAATPLGNALAALAFGALPTLFITLGTGRVEAALLLGHLVFFGLVLRSLRGRNALEKAMGHGLALSALTLIPEFTRVRTTLSFTAALVEALLMVGVLVTAGALMDALSTRRRWRSLLKLYDAPTVTRFLGGSVAAATAAAAGLLANESTAVVGLLWAQLQGGPGGP